MFGVNRGRIGAVRKCGRVRRWVHLLRVRRVALVRYAAGGLAHDRQQRVVHEIVEDDKAVLAEVGEPLRRGAFARQLELGVANARLWVEQQRGHGRRRRRAGDDVACQRAEAAGGGHLGRRRVAKLSSLMTR